MIEQYKLDVISKGMGWGKIESINNDQMVEIMEKLISYVRNGGDGLWKSDNYFKVQFKKNGFVGEGRTINEAVCNTAYEHFKGEK